MRKDTPEEIARWYLARGVKAVVVKTGAQGAYGATETEAFAEPTFRAERIVDTVGAGDGFAAGVISALAKDCRCANACAAATRSARCRL